GGRPRPSPMWQWLHATLLKIGPSPGFTGAGALTKMASNWPSPMACSRASDGLRPGKGWPKAPAPWSNTVWLPPLIQACSSAASHGAGSLRHAVMAATSAAAIANRARRRKGSTLLHVLLHQGKQVVVQGGGQRVDGVHGLLHLHLLRGDGLAERHGDGVQRVDG